MFFLAMPVVLLREEVGLTFLAVKFRRDFFARAGWSQAPVQTMVLSGKISGRLIGRRRVPGCLGA